MDVIIAFDSHKRYTLALVEDEKGREIDESRVEHERGAMGLLKKPESEPM